METITIGSPVKYLQTTLQAREVATSLTGKLKKSDEVLLDLSVIEGMTDNYAERTLRDLVFRNAEDIKQWQGKKVTVKSSEAVFETFKSGFQSVYKCVEHRQDKENLHNLITIAKNILQYQAA